MAGTILWVAGFLLVAVGAAFIWQHVVQQLAKAVGA